MLKKVSNLAVVLLVVPSTPAFADPHLDSVVYSPYVEKNMFELGSRYAEEIGRGSLKGVGALVTEAEYGVSDRLSIALLTKVKNEPGQRKKLTSVAFESVFYVGQVPKVGIDAGLYLELSKGLGGDSDGGEVKLLLAKTAGRFQGLLNLIAERPLNGPSSERYASYGYAASATWRAIGNLRLGAEAFGDLGDDHRFLRGAQGAYIGPQVKWEGRPEGSPVEFAIDAGWLAPLGPNRNEGRSQARVSIELEHRF